MPQNGHRRIRERTANLGARTGEKTTISQTESITGAPDLVMELAIGVIPETETITLTLVHGPLTKVIKGKRGRRVSVLLSHAQAQRLSEELARKLWRIQRRAKLDA